MLKHEVMAAYEIGQQIAINKMQSSLLSVAYACLYHKLAATMGNSSHNVDISKPFTHMKQSAICPV
jgi:hypothetical protein